MEDPLLPAIFLSFRLPLDLFVVASPCAPLLLEDGDEVTTDSVNLKYARHKGKRRACF